MSSIYTLSPISGIKDHFVILNFSKYFILKITWVFNLSLPIVIIRENPANFLFLLPSAMMLFRYVLEIKYRYGGSAC